MGLSNISLHPPYVVGAFLSWGWAVHFLACAAPNEYAELLEEQGVRTFHVLPNRGADFEAALEVAAPVGRRRCKLDPARLESAPA